jgi:hypothetical protein
MLRLTKTAEKHMFQFKSITGAQYVKMCEYKTFGNVLDFRPVYLQHSVSLRSERHTGSGGSARAILSSGSGDLSRLLLILYRTMSFHERLAVAFARESENLIPSDFYGRTCLRRIHDVKYPF